MEPQQQQMQSPQQTEILIEEMLSFLDSTSEEEDDHLDEPGLQQVDQQPVAELDGDVTLAPHLGKKEKKSKNSIAGELNKIKNQFPIWNTKELGPTAKKLTDPIWRQTYAMAAKQETADADNDWNSKLESNCRRSSNSYVQEVNRAIYGDTTGHPPNGSPEYFQAAQNYAIYGKDFLDFPENLTPLLSEKVVGTSTSPEATPFVGNYGNGLYPTPAAAPEITNAGMSFTNFGQSTGAGASAAAATAATYYQMCNGMQPRPAAGSTAYGMFLGNKVTYVAAAPTAPPLVYNQHSSTTTNFISNSLANAALASSPAILYSNPMLTTTTQQYLNTFFKETQYLSGGSAQGTTVGTTTGIYERLVYAQMLQQQIYHQTQQQAAAVAAMFQQHKQPRPAPRATPSGGAANPNTALPSQAAAATAMPVGLNLCGRQAAMAAANLPEMLVKQQPTNATVVPISSNGAEDIMPAPSPLND